jgi:hypothetical protein
MNSKEESEPSKFIFTDTSPRFVRDLKSQNENLYKEYLKLQDKLQKTKDSLSKIQLINSGLEKDLVLAKSNQKKIMAQKQAVEKELHDNKEYTRKIEQKIAVGAKGQSLAEMNMQLQSKFNDLKQEKQALVIKIQELESDINAYKLEITNLSSICALKADELGIKGENSHEILYSLASATQSSNNYKKMFEELKSNYEKALIKLEELQIIRESNNEELNELEEQNLKLKNEINEVIKINKELALDRNALLQCLEEMSAQQKQHEMDMEYFSKEFSAYQAQSKQQIFELNKEIQLKDDIIKSKNNLKTDEIGNLNRKYDQEIEILKKQVSGFLGLEKENCELKDTIKKVAQDTLDLKKDFESKEKRLKAKLAICFKELETLVNEKEEIQTALNNAVLKCSEKLPSEDRPRQIDDTMYLLSQAKQKNLDLLKMIS